MYKWICIQHGSIMSSNSTALKIPVLQLFIPHQFFNLHNESTFVPWKLRKLSFTSVLPCSVFVSYIIYIPCQGLCVLFSNHNCHDLKNITVFTSVSPLMNLLLFTFGLVGFQYQVILKTPYGCLGDMERWVEDNQSPPQQHNFKTEWSNIYRVLRERKCKPEFLYLAKLSFKHKVNRHSET